MIVVSIDPGLRGCGVAAWGNGELHDARYVPGEPRGEALAEVVEATAFAVGTWLGALRRRAEHAAHPGGAVPLGYAPGWDRVQVIIECPQTYGGRASQGDANDLIGVSMVVGAIGAHLGEPWIAVRPAAWKGQVPKKTKHKTNPIELRCRAKMTAAELCRVYLPKSKVNLGHNVWDAIGIGMWHLRR